MKEDITYGAVDHSVKGFLKAHDLGPKNEVFGNWPQRGKIGTGGVVTLRDGELIVVERDKGTPQPGNKVIVYQKVDRSQWPS